PLRQAEDAIYLDTSAMNIEQVTDKVMELVKERQ
ncbi:MAG: (d)CMP kinase, partial [Acidaminococcaceae bacterium]|nr:(d)CMP kinase [Acidaminococcaceae bacterium]